MRASYVLVLLAALVVCSLVVSATDQSCSNGGICDWNKREKCHEYNDKKFERCTNREREAYLECKKDARSRFRECLEHDAPCGLTKKDHSKAVGDDGRHDENKHKDNPRWEQCKSEFDEAKEKCEVQRLASHAGCLEAKECRETKCLYFIKDCKPCPSPSTTTTTTSSVTTTTTSNPLSKCPATEFFGAAADFNVFISGSDLLVYDLDLVNGDIEGRSAVNGGFRVSSFGTAQSYGCSNTSAQAKQFNLIVNGKMDYSNGQLFCGSSICLMNGNNPSLGQQLYGATNVLSASSSNLQATTGFDFSETSGYLKAVSDGFCDRNPGIQDGVSISEYSPSQVSNISISAGNYVNVINIVGSGDIDFTNFQISSAVAAYQVIYNVCGDNNVNISGFELNGHLLAINSDVVLENGHVTGNVYASSLVGSGSGQVNLAACP